ncbi:hypothetical protein HAX54_047613 [Datura stramonium]|uniref:Uncharacterized protein n=1 Tax=Datura stramonium TaxID=4076 RepID=A0ABS8WN55_DATST|nr:hypothetical protein [Datura stramonium]
MESRHNCFSSTEASKFDACRPSDSAVSGTVSAAVEAPFSDAGGTPDSDAEAVLLPAGTEAIGAVVLDPSRSSGLPGCAKPCFKRGLA